MKKLTITAAALLSCTLATAEWKYDSSVDKMTGAKAVRVTTISDNELSFGFPYSGPNAGYLTVRQHPQYGLDVIVRIDKGQMTCHTYNCPVSVKFDDAKPVAYGGTGAADSSSNVIFLKSPQKFIASAKKAKKILIQFNAFHNGSPVLEFSTPQQLIWPPK